MKVILLQKTIKNAFTYIVYSFFFFLNRCFAVRIWISYKDDSSVSWSEMKFKEENSAKMPEQ